MIKTSFILALALVSMSYAQASSRLSADQRVQIRKQFDKDGDGKLSAQERAATKQALIKRIDLNGDGNVDASERAAAKNARNQ